MSHSPRRTIPTAERPALSEKQRTERLLALTERLHSQDGLDRAALKEIETLTGDERRQGLGQLSVS